MKIQQIILDFRQKQYELSKHANRAFRGEYRNLKTLPAIEVPDLISDLLFPIVNELVEAMPELNLAPYTREGLGFCGGYCKIQNKDKTIVGRFSCKLDNAVTIFFACAKGNAFGENRGFSCFSELVEIINSSK